MWLCSICSQLFGRGNERLSATKCGHVYHRSCIMEWLETATSCPDCREHCTSGSVIMIYLPLMNAVSPERIDEVKRLNEIRATGLKTVQVIDKKLNEKIQTVGLDAKELKMFKDLSEHVNFLKDTFQSIENVTLTLTDIHARGRDIMERYEEIKEEGQSLRALADYSAKIQRDLDCYSNNHRRIQADSYENNLANITLRCENNSLECDLKILNEKVQYFSSCSELLRKEIADKQKTIKEEVEAKRKIANDLIEMNDKNKELLIKLETSEASMLPVLNTIKRLNKIINEKSELISLHTGRIKELNSFIEEMDEKLQSQKVEAMAKCHQKDSVILDQERRLAMYLLNCEELKEKLRGVERKILFYEAVIRGVIERKDEMDSTILTLRMLHDQTEDSKVEEPKAEEDKPGK